MVAECLRAMGDPSRLRILGELCGGEQSVTSLTAATGLSQANVSRHLGVLRRAALVEFRREGRHVFYRLTNDLPRTICGLVCFSLEQRTTAGRSALRTFRKEFHE
ncbi:MAG: winged helix-turn-helix transcriptional regulator [Candidatus Krumholzibacteriota bacterium]|nr:winged helix-turn-helix transcriptional regulator [Candidatus Krumholzibacteriota bacterium]